MIVFDTHNEHESKIQLIQKSLINSDRRFTLESRNSNTLRNGEYKKNSQRLDLSHLNAPLYLDPKEETIVVEPQITFENLCKLTLRHGWVPLVVPEFKNITVAGAIMGASLESSSHLYGQFSDTCLEYECLLGNGERLSCSPHENADLFYGLSGSYGTLTLLSAIKIKLKKAKKYVQLTHHFFSDRKEAFQLLKREHSSDFLDAVILSPNRMVVISGVLNDQPKGIFFRQNFWGAPWYISHLLKNSFSETHMTLDDYLFRFDRGAFWMGRYISNLQTLIKTLFKIGSPTAKFPKFFSRLFFGAWFSSKSLYKFWHRVPTSFSKNLFFVHDFYLPLETFEEALETFLKKTEIFPVWLCPLLGTKTPQFLSPHFGASRYINIGLYGIPKKREAVVQLSKELEVEVLRFNGRKMLYSPTYYDFNTFSKAYNLNCYDELRKKYGAEKTFLHIYDKVNNSTL